MMNNILTPRVNTLLPPPKGYISQIQHSPHKLCTDSPNGYLGGVKIPEDKVWSENFEERKIEVKGEGRGKLKRKGKRKPQEW
jgi:hypothetical protein